MKILRATLYKKWFDLILSGEKTEEYREIKPYWIKRLEKKYDAILFQNGYLIDSPKMLVEYKGYKIDKINNRFILFLGKVLKYPY